eukprot:687133-Pelagomonas_calceolata.AAC.2
MEIESGNFASALSREKDIGSPPCHTNYAGHLQFQLNKFHEYACCKALTSQHRQNEGHTKWHVTPWEALPEYTKLVLSLPTVVHTDAKYGLQQTLLQAAIQAFSSLFWVLREQQKHTASQGRRGRWLCTFTGSGECVRLQAFGKFGFLYWAQTMPPDRVVQADLRLADNKYNCNYQVLTALNDVPHAQQITAATCIRARINMND